MKSNGPENYGEYALRYGVHEIEDEVAEAMFEPTSFMPGSPEKMEVMAARLALGQPLFHPKDRTIQSVLQEQDQ